MVNSGGMLGGTDTIGGAATINSGGVLAAGTSAGALTAASATMMAGSSLNVELGGAIAGSQYDELLVTGPLTLDGALSISLINGFIPSAGQAFNILDWGTLAGTFSSLNLPTLVVCYNGACLIQPPIPIETLDFRWPNANRFLYGVAQ